MIYYKVCYNYLDKNYSYVVSERNILASWQHISTYKLNEITTATIGGLAVFENLKYLRQFCGHDRQNLVYYECECYEPTEHQCVSLYDIELTNPEWLSTWPKGTKLFKCVKPIRKLEIDEVWK